MMAKKNLVIGLDIGGTKITGVLFDGKTVQKELTIVTPKNLFEFQHNLGKLIAFLSGREKVGKIGVGMAGLVNKSRGTVKYSPNIKYIRNFELKRFLQSKGFKKIEIDNDASCFLLAECVLGQVKSFKNVIGITLGTGIGGAFLIRGKLYRGSDNFGGEVGRMVMDKSFWEKLFQIARDKNDYKTLTKLTGQGLANLINLFDPDCFIFGGALSIHQPKIIKNALQEARHYLLNSEANPKIFVSKLKNAGAIGAALLVK